jgi:hypothetical protein
MPGFTDYKLRMEILADGYKAKSEIKSVDDQINKLGAGLASSLGSAALPAGVIAGGLLAMGTAAVTATGYLFQLTKQAADYGSEIYNATVKTGLHAETISALQLASDRTGVSMESLGTIVNRFSKVVGEAAQGSDEAKEKLTRLGLDPKQAMTDLDGTLGKVFLKIQNMPNQIAKATAAQQLFGKAGTELLKILDDFHGDLPALIAEAKKLGITMSDEDAAAADAFGDQLDMLSRQLKGAAVAVGKELMPVFQDMAHSMSDWLVDNKGLWADWGDVVAGALRRTVSEAEKTAGWFSQHPELTEFMRQMAGFALHGPGYMGQGLISGDFTANKGGVYGQEDELKLMREKPWLFQPKPKAGDDYLKDLGKAKKPPKETDSEFRKFFQQYGFDVTRTFGGALNKGSVHPLGLAADVSVRGKSVDDISKLIAAAIEKGYRLVDERKKIPGVNQTGPHLHFERTGSDKASIFQGDQSMYGNVPVGYLQELDKQRRGKAPASQESIAQFNKKIYDEDLANWNAAWERKTQINESGLNVMIQQEERRYQKATENADDSTAMEAAQQSHDLQVQLIEDEIRALEEKYNAAAVGSKEEADLANQVAIKKIEADLKVADADDELEQRKKSIHAAQNKRIDEEAAWVEKMLKYAKDLGDQYDELREKIWNAQMAQAEMNARQGEWIESLRAAQPWEQAKMEMADMINGAFEQFTQGIGSAIEAWVLYGEAGRTRCER